MILRLQHIGTAYANHADAAARLARVGLAPAELRTDQGRGFQHDSRALLGNECWLHVVHNWNPEARVCRFLAEHGEGLEHLAIETDDIEAAVARVRRNAPIWEDRILQEAADGFEAFVYPEDACGFTVELIQPHPTSWNWPDPPPERVSPLLRIRRLAEVVAGAPDPPAAGARFHQLFDLAPEPDGGDVLIPFRNDCRIRFRRGAPPGLHALVFESADPDADRRALGPLASGPGPDVQVAAEAVGFGIEIRGPDRS